MSCLGLFLALLLHVSAGVGFEVLSVQEADGTGGMYTASAILGDGLPATSSYDPVNKQVRFIHCKDVDCNKSSMQLIGHGGRTQSMVTTSAGLPVIGFCNSKGKFEVAACRDFECSRSASLPTEGSCGMYTSASQGAVDGQAGPRPAFAFSDEESVYVVRCSDTNCSAASSPRRVASGTGYPSVGVLPGDVPIVAFTDRSSYNAKLKVAICTDATCKESSVMLLDDSSDFAYTSIAIVNSLPVILAADDGKSTMIVFKCSDAMCGSHNKKVLETTGPKGKGSYGEFPHIVAAPSWLQDQGIAFAAAYYSTLSSSKGVARVALCTNELNCDLHTVASGDCGYGRDASLAFGVAGSNTANRGYYACMRYAGKSSGRKPVLAVLNFDSGLGATGHTDICKGSSLDFEVQV